jgi:hypothetical protein
MPRADTFPNTFCLRKPFEELPLFSFSTDKQGETYRTGYISGEFEVTVSYLDGDWHFSDLWISANNGKMGAEAKGELLRLDADVDERFFLMVLDVLEARYTTRVEEWIEDELAEAA